MNLLLRSAHGSANMAHPLCEALAAIPTPTRVPYHQPPSRRCWGYDLVKAPFAPCQMLMAGPWDLCARPACALRHSQFLVGVEPCMHLHARRHTGCIAQGYTLKVFPLHPRVCLAPATAPSGWAAGGWEAAFRLCLCGMRAPPRHGGLRLPHHAVATRSSGENVEIYVYKLIEHE